MQHGNRRYPFANQTAKLNWELAPQVTFIPFRGKLAIFNKIFVDTDFYLAAGLAFVGIQERQNCGAQRSGPVLRPGVFQLRPGERDHRDVRPRPHVLRCGLLVVRHRVPRAAVQLEPPGFDSRGSGTNGNFPDGKIDSNDDTFDVQPDGHVGRRVLLPDRSDASASRTMRARVR